MEASVSSSLGAMGSVIGKLGVLLLGTSEDDSADLQRRLRFPKEFKDGIHLLKEDLEEIGTYLEDLSEMEDPSLTAKCFMREVRELSYDIEDYIDSFARPGHTSNTETRFICKKISHVKLSRLPKKNLRHKRVADKISEFRIRAQDANERYQRYELDSHNFRRRYAPVGPMLPTPFQDGADLVIDSQMREFTDTLASDRDHCLKVISILGPGGIGKTTLVRMLYKEIRGQFHLRAFVQTPQKPDVKTVLCEILKQVQRQKLSDHCEDLDLIGKIRNHLQDKRYLIVIDDLWVPSVWNIINHAFPDGSQHSRIIITTQIEEVALTCCSYCSEFVLEMKPMDSYHSRKLFFNRTFGSKSECPDTFREVSNKIVKTCGGFPLATISMATLLASHPVVLIEQWTHIYDSLSSNLRTSSTSEGVRQVLNLSYNNLPCYLKTCLLYLNMYPEGYTIHKDDLVKQWVAEGFVDTTEGRDVERVARSYFDELIDRRFLLPGYIKYNNEMVSCTVHHMVHDLIAYKSLEENFVMAIDNYQKNVEICYNVHRLSLHFVDAKHAKKPANVRTSQVRSFSYFGFFTCMPNITEFKLLRVLNVQLYDHHGEDIFDFTGISELFHLRYLMVAGNIHIELPKHMRGLQYMETLNIDIKVTAVPWDIIHLPFLLHLHLPSETNLMDWIGSIKSADVQELGMLTNLRDLRLTCFTTTPLDHLEQNLEALGSLLAGLGNLKTLALVTGRFHENVVAPNPSKVTISWDGFTPPIPLQRFEWSPCSYIFSRVPKWIGESGNLCVLKIAVKELPRGSISILKGLPALTTLSLYMHADAAPSKTIVFDKVGFSVLKYFKFKCSVPWLKFEADAMPNLWILKLGFNAHGVDQHGSTCISIERLPGLKEISVKIGGASADAEFALTDAIVNHPSNPQINIQLVDWIFYGDKVRNTVFEKKEHRRIEQQDDIMDQTGHEVSTEDVNKRTEQEKQGRTEQGVILEYTENLVSSKDEDEKKQSRERKRRRIEQQGDIMEEREDEATREDWNKQVDAINYTPMVPSSCKPISDIDQILKEAQHRWLRPAEICEILKNYRNFCIAPEPPYRPPSGALFLFNRRVLRYFRKDGHNWKKKNDQKTVKEAHERLKSGSTDQIQCYYALGEENINFQRRTYWMVDEELTHITLVHYLETKGAKSFKPRGNNNMIRKEYVYSGRPATDSSAFSSDIPASSIVTELDNVPVQTPLQFPVPHEQGTSTEGWAYDFWAYDSLTFDESSSLKLKDIGSAGVDRESFSQFSGATSDLSTIDNTLPQQNDGSLETVISEQILKTQPSNLSDTQWFSKLDKLSDFQIQSSSGLHWSTEEENCVTETSNREPADHFTVSPTFMKDQLFSIVDVTPRWTYVGSKTKIFVSGSILNNSQVTERCRWSCMFGEDEVPAKILADGTLICYSPRHKPGRVPFYITCSNRLACSEVQEFEFRPTVTQYMDAPSPHGATNKAYFQIRLDKLLSLGADEYQASVSNPSTEMIELSKKISSLMMSNDEWSNLLNEAVDNEPSTDDQQDQFAENLIKYKLPVWLLNKVGVGCKGPSVLDDEGQGVLHLAAALGYDWAIRPTLAAGVNINFRDVHGWTALHWAAFCGRERTVVALTALGAAPGALTDPSPDFPESTPADLASANGQKGISGFLAESSLTSHLRALNLKEANMAEISGLPGIGDVTERDSVLPPTEDSWGAVRNAAQAVAQIYQVFRVQSFQRKQAAQYEDSKGAMSDEGTLPLISVKPSKLGQLDPVHSAATRIQKKFRGWKGRKEFLLIRQRVAKIQALVRGHQVRKHYQKIVWTVGVVEKVILRWRRRGVGLRGFRSIEGSTEGSSGGTSSSLIQDKPSGDDYDFLEEGRKQTEKRLQKALTRVKSMAQNPEARDQYQRIFTVMSKMQESQATQEKMLEESAEMDDDYFMNELKELWDDDTHIPGYL